jgi:DNA-binding Lrp family transcriptional regulator
MTRGIHGDDVEALRALLLALENVQRSPPEPIFVAVGELAQLLQISRSEIIERLDRLAGLNFIEGPGAYRESDWLFRRLTRRGEALAELIRDPDDWREALETYGPFLAR